ncbi:hypothetical protein N7454_008708 [Penicillium verhagenii]|nr:hypothetical protein N7454_008708 [Penicillium verhagenii]
MKYTIQQNWFVVFGAMLASTATAAYFPGGLLSPHFTSLDKRTIPTADSDGVCYTYTVEAGDTCTSIATAFGITIAEIEEYNTDVWAWDGCNDVKQGAFVCLSSGLPTMPVALPHAICGPQVPGTARPTDMSKSHLASLNPCASNDCCSLDGYCGTTSAYCSSTECISNCDAKAASAVTTSTVSKESSTTTAAKTTSTKSTSTSTTSTTSKTSTKSSTTSTASSTKTSTTTTKKATTTVDTSVSTSTPWSITIYYEPKCDAGDQGYYLVGGWNYDRTDDCLVLSGGDMPTDDSGPDPWCQWWADGGNAGYTGCGSSTLVHPQSYYITSGQCWAYSDDACSDYSGQIDSPIIGCQYPGKKSWNPTTIRSMQCAEI